MSWNIETPEPVDQEDIRIGLASAAVTNGEEHNEEEQDQIKAAITAAEVIADKAEFHGKQVRAKISGAYGLVSVTVAEAAEPEA